MLFVDERPIQSDNMVYRCVRDTEDSWFQCYILQNLENSDMDVTDEEDSITLVTDLFQVSMFILFCF